jgi:serine/threonine protein kinase
LTDSWGVNCEKPWFSTIHDILHYMKCLLQVCLSLRKPRTIPVKRISAGAGIPPQQSHCAWCKCHVADFTSPCSWNVKDITPNIFVINEFSEHPFEYATDAAEWRAYFSSRDVPDTSRTRFAIIDFGFSYRFPEGTPAQQRRLLSAKHGWTGSPWYHPPDIEQGEYDFDPFAMDVGSLGNVFCELFEVGSVT